jgi:cephalosporin hydroxylase
MRFPAALALALASLALSGCRHARPSAPVSLVTLASDAQSPRILRGVFPGDGGWRWTSPAFAFSLDRPSTAAPVFVELDFDAPEELFPSATTVTVVAKVNGAEVARDTVPKSGRRTLAARVPPDALTRMPAEVEFSADRSFTDGATGAVHSLIVFSAGLKEYEQTAAFREAELAKSRTAYAQVLQQRNLKLPLEKQREIMKLFHDLPIWESLWFQNVRIIKNPLDLWMLQQVAYEVQPDAVVETGTWYGGSALWWAHTLSGMGLDNTRVLTVDIQDLTNQGASSHKLWKKHVDFFLGSSTDPKIVSRIAEKVRHRRVIVNLDSDHSMQHVLNELHLYAPMVTPGSYIAVEDTHLDGIPTHPEQGPGPMAAVLRFLSEPAGQDFEQDFTREAMVMTSYPGGWLRRKK